MTVKQAKIAGIIGLICLIISIVILRQQNISEQIVEEEAKKPSWNLHQESLTLYEAKNGIYDPMPRSTSVFSMEVADVEAAVLLAEIKEKKEQATGCLTASAGVFQGPSGKETWYDLEMSGVVDIMRHRGFDEATYPYWVREDGVKMLGDYVMVAANTNDLPKGSIVETSLGIGLIVDHCPAGNFDIATSWGR